MWLIDLNKSNTDRQNNPAVPVQSRNQVYDRQRNKSSIVS